MSNIKLAVEFLLIGGVVGYFLNHIIKLIAITIKEINIAKKEWNKSQ